MIGDEIRESAGLTPSRGPHDNGCVDAIVGPLNAVAIRNSTRHALADANCFAWTL